MGAKVKDLTGQTFNKLTALELVGMSNNHAVWKCRCECGVIVRVIGAKLAHGTVKSCGCQRSVAAHRRKPKVKQRNGRINFLSTDNDF